MKELQNYVAKISVFPHSTMIFSLKDIGKTLNVNFNNKLGIRNQELTILL